GRERLFADALRVGVDVGPAPEERPLDARIHQLVLDELALDLRELVIERLAPAGLAPLGEGVLRLVEERALPEGVVAALPRLLDEVEALVDLALRVPVGRVEGPVRRAGAVPCLALGAGERHLARVDLLDQA